MLGRSNLSFEPSFGTRWVIVFLFFFINVFPLRLFSLCYGLIPPTLSHGSWSSLSELRRVGLANQNIDMDAIDFDINNPLHATAFRETYINQKHPTGKRESGELRFLKHQKRKVESQRVLAFEASSPPSNFHPYDVHNSTLQLQLYSYCHRFIRYRYWKSTRFHFSNHNDRVNVPLIEIAQWKSQFFLNSIFEYRSDIRLRKPVVSKWYFEGVAMEIT